MYDFCITPIYAFLLGCGGLAGYFVAGSTTSLLMGLGAALALGVLTYVSLQKFEVGCPRCLSHKTSCCLHS